MVVSKKWSLKDLVCRGREQSEDLCPACLNDLNEQNRPHQLSTHFLGGIKQAANTSQIKGFPPDNTLFGLVPYNDPCTSYIKLGCSPPPFPAS